MQKIYQCRFLASQPSQFDIHKILPEPSRRHRKKINGRNPYQNVKEITFLEVKLDIKAKSRRVWKIGEQWLFELYLNKFYLNNI